MSVGAVGVAQLLANALQTLPLTTVRSGVSKVVDSFTFPTLEYSRELSDCAVCCQGSEAIETSSTATWKRGGEVITLDRKYPWGYHPAPKSNKCRTIIFFLIAAPLLATIYFVIAVLLYSLLSRSLLCTVRAFRLQIFLSVSRSTSRPLFPKFS